MTVELLLFVFVLAMFLGVELIRKVPGNLHTPLMSGSNAISGICLIGALVALADAATMGSAVGMVFSAMAVALATINVVGGYAVTDRMLKMFGGPSGSKGGAR